jgi:thiol-disulfide isomerase/thioredoxin
MANPAMRTASMKIWLLALMLLLTACDRHKDTAESDPESGQGRAEAAGQALIGRAAPQATLRTIDGKEIRLADAYGEKPVYLKFWATWCVPCRQQMPGYEQDYEALGDKIDFVAVNAGFSETEDGVRAYRQTLGLRMPIAIDDGTLAQSLDLRVTPQHVVIGRDGRILYVGHLADERLHQALDAAIAEAGVREISRTPPATTTAAATEPVYHPGDRPQDLSVTTADGATQKLFGTAPGAASQVLVFFSPWCESYWKESRPTESAACRQVRETADRVAGKGDRWLGIASGLWASPKDLDDYRNETKTHLPIVLDSDGRLFRAFDIHGVPSVILIGADGRIARKLEAGDPDFEQALAAR